MTEEEAKSKRCPILDRGHCVGSVCMAWRWAKMTKDVPSISADKAKEDGFHIIGYEATLLDVTYKMAKLTGSGYCGLGGTP